MSGSSDCTAILSNLHGVVLGIFGQPKKWRIGDESTYSRYSIDDIRQDTSSALDGSKQNDYTNEQTKLKIPLLAVANSRAKTPDAPIFNMTRPPSTTPEHDTTSLFDDDDSKTSHRKRPVSMSSQSTRVDRVNSIEQRVSCNCHVLIVQISNSLKQSIHDISNNMHESFGVVFDEQEIERELANSQFKQLHMHQFRQHILSNIDEAVQRVTKYVELQELEPFQSALFLP